MIDAEPQVYFRIKSEETNVKAAIDFAMATETMADGQKRAEIKKAEGIRQAEILKAEGEAQAIQLVNEAADRFFVSNAQTLRKLQAVEEALRNNSKIILPVDGQLVNVIGDMAGIPIPKDKVAVPNPVLRRLLPAGTPFMVTDMLLWAAQDEYLAHGKYAAIMKKFGTMRPYDNIMAAEEQHLA